MNDEEFADAWTTLSPTMDQRRRIGTRVFTWLDARDTPLAAEWFGLFRVAPFTALGLAAVSGLATIAAPPLVWFARALI